MWQSKRMRQFLKSTVTAETSALADAAEASFCLSKLFVEICNTTEKSVALPLNCYIDRKQLHEALYSMCPVLDKRVEIGILCEMLEKKEINSVKWICHEEQLANCLKKRGASCDSLLNVLSLVKED